MIVVFYSSVIASSSLSIADQVLISCVSGLIGAIITLLGALFVFYRGKEEAKKQFLFEFYLRELFPLVYNPILNEYYNYINAQYDGSTYNIKINLLETTIRENYTIIKFSPRKIRHHISTLHSHCKAIDSTAKYNQKEKDIINSMEIIKNELEDHFKGYLNG